MTAENFGHNPVIRTPQKKNALSTMEDIEMQFVKIHGKNPDSVNRKTIQNIDLDDTSHPYQLFGTDIIDAGVINHASNSDYEPPGRDNTEALLNATPIAEKNLGDTVTKFPEVTNIKIKDSNMIPVVTREGNLYNCLLCEGKENVCDKAKAIISHVWQAHHERLYICDVCGQDFRKRDKLSTHLKKHYPQRKAWGCDACDKTYTSKKLLDDHINIHKGVRPYVCPTCGQDFASKYNLKGHEKTHKVRPRPFQCRPCNKSFYNQKHLTQHEWTHANQLGSVHSITHSNYKSSLCDLCGKIFMGEAKLLDHKRTHTDERPFLCEFCGITLKYESNLKSHQYKTHSQGRYKCEKCEKGFNRKRSLYHHFQDSHMREQQYKCLVCEVAFVNQLYLKMHERIHTGENSFKCEVCGKVFKKQYNRNTHLFIHLDKKRYECPICNAGFMRKHPLIQHMQAQGHLNDTCNVYQVMPIKDAHQIIKESADGTMEITEIGVVAEDDGVEDSTLVEHMVIEGGEILTDTKTLEC